MAKESAIMVQQECIELVDRSIPRSAHIAGQIFSVRREEFHSWASPWKIYLCGWHNESRTQQINTAPSCCWLSGLSPTQKRRHSHDQQCRLYDSDFSLLINLILFFSLLNFSTQTTMPAVYGGVCVYTHTQAIQAVSSLDRFPIFLLLLRWGSF